MTKKNAHKCSEGNTNTSERYRWFPSFTFFPENGDKSITPHFDGETMKYLIYGWEQCPTTLRMHWQGAVYFVDKRSLKNAQKLLCIGKSHMEWKMKAKTMEEPINYCKKGEDWYEFGEPPMQGKRADLKVLKDELVNDEITVDDIIMNNPKIYHQYGRTLEKIETIVLRRKFRTWETERIWYYGDTGTGKSHTVFQDYDPDKTYLWCNDGRWWDGYKGHENVIINEFRGEIAYADLLQLVDKWPYKVSNRSKEQIPFLAKKIMITSSMHPYIIYKDKLQKEDKWVQFTRRFRIIKLGPGGIPIKIEERTSEKTEHTDEETESTNPLDEGI